MALEDELFDGAARSGIRRFTVAVDIENTWSGRLGGLEIERREPDAGLGVEDDLLDGIAGALDLADLSSTGLGQACQGPNTGDLAHLGKRLGAILQAP